MTLNALSIDSLILIHYLAKSLGLCSDIVSLIKATEQPADTPIQCCFLTSLQKLLLMMAFK